MHRLIFGLVLLLAAGAAFITLGYTAAAAGFGFLLALPAAWLVARRLSRVSLGIDDRGREHFTRIKMGLLREQVWDDGLGRSALFVGAASILGAFIPAVGFFGVVRSAFVTAGLISSAVLIWRSGFIGSCWRTVRRQDAAQRASLADAVRYITGMTLRAFEETARWQVQKDGAIVISSPPEAVAAALKNADRVTQVMSGFVAEAHGTSVLLRPATAAEQAQQRLVESSGGLVVGIDGPDADGAYELTLQDGISPTQAEKVDAWANKVAGATLLAWHPLQHRARVAVLDETDRQVRDRVATLLGARPHEITLNVTSDADGIESVEVFKAPGSKATDHASAIELWRKVLLQAVDGSHPDWDVEVDRLTDAVMLKRRAPRALPKSVALADILPAQVTPDGWDRIAIGFASDGTAQGQDLQSAPMAVWAGATGSGKTVGLLADMSQRLMRGHDVFVIDPTKGGVDFSALLPYTRAFARDFAESVTLIKAVYAEGVRRKSVLLREQEVKWSDLPDSVRRSENIRPLTLYIDELASLLIAPAIPKGLPKDDPDLLDAQELAAQKGLLSMYVGKIARELRFVGVFLVVALQRPDASILGGEVRANLSHRVQLVAKGKAPGQTELQMLFPAHVVPEVYSEIQRFDDGKSAGLAVTAGEEGNVNALRVAYSPMREIPALLEARGVQPVSDADRIPLATVERESEAASERSDEAADAFDAFA